jgi:hypothetical protein
LGEGNPCIFCRQARQILQPLALCLHEKDERRSAPLEEVMAVIRDPFEQIGKAGLDPEQLLRNIRDRSGLSNCRTFT